MRVSAKCAHREDPNVLPVSTVLSVTGGTLDLGGVRGQVVSSGGGDIIIGSGVMERIREAIACTFPINPPGERVDGGMRG